MRSLTKVQQQSYACEILAVFRHDANKIDDIFETG